MITHRVSSCGFGVAASDQQSVLDELVAAGGVSSGRELILEIETRMRELPGQMELEPTHHFSKGIYARELRIPAGTLLTGKIHKFENLNIISQGDISVVTEDGVKRIQAPCTLVSPPGTKRIGYAHTDTVWTTIHATEETDLEALEAELIAASFEEFDRFQQQALVMKEGAACLGER
jgi:hypothetical protein